MKLYLSSYKIGNDPQKLTSLFSENKKIGYIPNAFDFTSANPQKVKEHMTADITALTEIGFDVQILDLKDFFGNEDSLKKIIDTLGGVWVSGGNVFVLRQAMKLSGFDNLLHTLMQRNDFVYGGYSAAGCVLSKKLDAYQIVDDATDMPYAEQKEVIWEGIGLIDFAFLPHFDSDHHESAAIDKEVEYCTQQNIPFKTLRDGDVLIID
jgi:dipeptidase E